MINSQRTPLTWLMVTAMTMSMLPLFLLGALGPRLIIEFRVATSALGVLVAVGFAVAAALSLIIGPAVAAWGARRCLIGMFVVSAIALGLFAAAPSFPVLVIAVALSGPSQALANPVTNQLIKSRVDPARRGGVAGWKQSGVQFGAFLAGLPLAVVAGAVNWRIAVAIPALAALPAAGAAAMIAGDSEPPRRPVLKVAVPRGDAGWMCGYSVLLGAGISAINTYTAVYAAHRLGMSPATSSGLVAVLGVAGILGRLGWTRHSASLRSPAVLLAPLAFGAVGASLVLLLAGPTQAWLVWLGVLGIGGCAVAANAVSMMTVIATAAPEFVGRDSAVVSAGFFAGFVVGPTIFGALIDAGSPHFTVSWMVVAAEFLAAAAVAWRWQRRASVR